MNSMDNYSKAWRSINKYGTEWKYGKVCKIMKTYDEVLRSMTTMKHMKKYEPVWESMKTCENVWQRMGKYQTYWTYETVWKSVKMKKYGNFEKQLWRSMKNTQIIKSLWKYEQVWESMKQYWNVWTCEKHKKFDKVLGGMESMKI